MRVLLFLLEKEFKQIFRNKLMARMIVLVPIMQMLVLVPAVTLEIKDIRLCVIDYDMSSSSRALVNMFRGSGFFKISFTTFSADEAEKKLAGNYADAVMIIPDKFEKNIKTGRGSSVQFLINAINGSFAQSVYAFSQGIVMRFNQDISLELSLSNVKRINIISKFWYNEELEYENYMLPGILVILVTVIALLLSGLNLVREKEIGTSEQINVTPIKKYQFIAGKLIPFWLIALFDFSFGLFLGKLVYHIPIEGNLFLLFFVLSIYIAGVLGIGLFLSTFAETQQQFLFVIFFFQMIFVLMSGIFTPLDSMPLWAQILNSINPVAHFIVVIRMVILKGATFHQISGEITILTLLATSVLSLAVLSYKKRS